MKPPIKFLNIFFSILVLGGVILMFYGFRTDCPGTAGYVSCSAMEK